MPTAIRRRGEKRATVKPHKAPPVKPVVKARRKLGARITGPCVVQEFGYDRNTGESRCVWSGEFSHGDAATSSDTYALIFVQRRDDKPDAVKVAPVGPSGAFIHVGHSGWFDLPAGCIAHGIMPAALPDGVRKAVDEWLGKRKHAACRLLDRAAMDYETLRVKVDTSKVTPGEAAAVNKGTARD